MLNCTMCIFTAALDAHHWQCSWLLGSTKKNRAVSRKVVNILNVAKCKPEFLNVNTSFLLSSLSKDIGGIISDDDNRSYLIE